MAKILLAAFLLFSLHAVGSGNPALTVRQQVEKAYLQEVGVRELTGKNDGVRVEAYLRSVGARKGQPWCAAFVSYILRKCGVNAPRSAWSPAFFPDRNLIFHRQKKPDLKSVSILPGQVFGIFFRNMGRIAHVGFTHRRIKNAIVTIEGNTNGAGSREGNGVYEKIRPLQSIYAISDFIQ
jgi:hypothetical protein